MTHNEIDAMQAGPEMDRMVAEKVMGWRPPDCDHGPGRMCGLCWPSDPLPRYSTDLNAAVEACGARPFTLRRGRARYWARVQYGDQPHYESRLVRTRSASAETSALALCRALLKAVSP